MQRGFLINDGVLEKYLGEDAFSENEKIKSVIIGEGVRCIDSLAFYGCKSLSHLEIGNGVDWICESAFYGCDSLCYNEFDNALYLGNKANPYTVLARARDKEIPLCKIHKGTKIIHGSAFFGCKAIKTIDIPTGVIAIGGSAFFDCDSLCEVSIPPTARYIGREAFSRCESLSHVEIPRSVTHKYARDNSMKFAAI